MSYEGANDNVDDLYKLEAPEIAEEIHAILDQSFSKEDKIFGLQLAVGSFICTTGSSKEHAMQMIDNFAKEVKEQIEDFDAGELCAWNPL